MRNQQSKRALACAKPMWWRVQAERKVADMRSWLRARRGHAGSSDRTARQKSSFRWLQSTVSRRFVTTKLGASCAPLPAERARLVQRRRRPQRSCWCGISKLRTSASTPRTPCKCAAYAVAPDPTRPPSGFVCSQETLESFPRKLGELAHKTVSGVEAHEASYTKEIETQKVTLVKRGVKG